MIRRFIHNLISSVLIAAGIGLSGFACAQVITDEAQTLYQTYQDSVFQIQVIDLATGKKKAIGSGFVFNQDERLIATNYHVISQYVYKPFNYKIQSISNIGDTVDISLINFDVVHDLAILRANTPIELDPLILGTSVMDKGSRIFSIGNPHDLGMTIVEGTFNGLMEQSMYPKILFSGSLNAGMSGGPAINHEGQVVGVNVSTMGNQVSFLVPVEYLIDLQSLKMSVDKIEGEQIESIADPEDELAPDYFLNIQNQVTAFNNETFNVILNSNWEKVKIGKSRMPGQITKAFKCWGDTHEDEKLTNRIHYIKCSNENYTFLHNDHYIGNITYKYSWVTDLGHNPIRFYNILEHYFSYAEAYNNADAEFVEDFVCNNNFVNLDGRATKMIMCARKYKKYPHLYDVAFTFVLVDQMEETLMVEVNLSGVSQKNSEEFIQHFLKDVQWTQ